MNDWLKEEAKKLHEEGKELCLDCKWEKETTKVWDGKVYHPLYCSHPYHAHDRADGCGHSCLSEACSLFEARE